MGYYSDFRIELSNESIDLEEVKNEIKRISGYSGFNIVRDKIYMSECKWYDAPNDMIALSKRYPNNLFSVYVQGEESEDNYVMYFKNGDFKRGNATIHYPTYDELKGK